MRRSLLSLFAIGVLISLAGVASADHRTGSYPKVRTFSGGYYGPTQAHYQYQRRYGRPWHGQGGLSGHHSVSFGRPSYVTGGFGYGPTYGFPGWGYSSYHSYYSGSIFGPVCNWTSPWVSYPLGVTVVQPSIVLQTPGIYAPLPTASPLAAEALLHNGALLQQQDPSLLMPNVQELGVVPLGDPDIPLLPTSTPAAQLRSLQHQQHGDTRMRNADYLQASLRYQDAIRAAGDRVEPHYRLGIALAGMKRFDKAVQELKAATAIDPDWVDSVTLTDLLGDDQLIAKTALKQRVAEWTLGDAYDADRLYLLGTLLHLDGDPQRARIMFNTATALVGPEPHLTAFLVSTPAPSGPPNDAPQDTVVPPLPPLPAPDKTSLPADQLLPDDTAQTHPVLRQPSGPIFPSSF